MLAALLALAASFTWGTSNYLGGFESRTRSVWHVTALSQMAAAGAAAVALLGAQQGPQGSWDLLVLIFTGAITAAGLVMFYQALAIGTMSVVAPIISGTVLIPVTAGILGGERPGLHAYIGMVVTVLGIVLISWGREGQRDRVAKMAVLLAVLTAICWGFMLYIYGTVGKASPIWAVFDTRITSAVVLAAYVLFTGRGLRRQGVGRRGDPRRAEVGRDVLVLVAIGVLLTAANVLFIFATGIGYLSVVSILGSLSPVVVTGYAQLLLHERLAPRQWMGFVAVLVGIVLLSV